VDHLSRDTRHAVRWLARDWRFTLAAVLILALGIGANTAIFSVVNTALFRPQPVRDSHELVNIDQNNARDGQAGGTSYAAYLDMTAYDDVFAGVTAFSIPMPVRYEVGEILQSGVVEHATSSYLSVLGLEPALGRWFNEAEDRSGGGAVAVIGYDAWITRFGAAPSVIGQTIRIDGEPVTVVGVGPQGYHLRSGPQPRSCRAGRPVVSARRDGRCSTPASPRP
jgi:hypothetical protein